MDWKNCSSCKKPIAHGGKYYKCSVSTCNSVRLPMIFCSVGCWDAHVPVLNHRANVWAIEDRAPAPAGAPERRLIRPPSGPVEPDEVLIIASRLKEFVKDRADFNTAGDVMDALSELVRDATVEAIANARLEGRRTIMARDFRRR
ncbi:MAG: hypothetical protein EXR71_04450 [Myxococcales bacterium]|nr:hypothetical protein [Myxococcales bacterium]